MITNQDTQKLWKKFCEDFDDAVEECLDKGTSKRMSISDATVPRTVIVDIYEAGGTMKKFNDGILGAVKKQTGMDLKLNDS